MGSHLWNVAGRSLAREVGALDAVLSFTPGKLFLQLQL
jgi:hypothetical protein